MKYAFDVNKVVKHYGKTKALDGITLKAEQGTIFGLLGPNGAGKTTLVRMLCTLLKPDSGSLKVLGVDVVDDPHNVRTRIGLAGQYAAVDEFLTGYENIIMAGRLYGLSAKESKKRAQEILERFNLVEAGSKPVRTYSGGMRRRLDLGASLIGTPDVLFLDEPTTGLDPRTRQDLWSIIRELVNQGTSIVLTTQYLEEADELAEKIAVIDQGKVIAQGTSSQLKSMIGGDLVEVVMANEAQTKKVVALSEKFATKKINVDDDHIKIPVSKGSAGLLEIVRELDKAKLKPVEIALHRPSLDDVFLTITGKKTENKSAEIPQKGRKR